MITVAILGGLVTGVLSGLLGIGGGAVLVLVAVFFLGVPQHAAQAAALVAIVPTAVVGVVRHHRNGLINYRMGLFLAVGAIIGGMLGAYIANLLSELALRRVFSAFFAIMSLQMFWSSYKLGRQEKTAEKDN